MLTTRQLSRVASLSHAKQLRRSRLICVSFSASSSTDSLPGSDAASSQSDVPRKDSNLQQQLMDFALLQVHQHGWTRRALVEAAAQLQQQQRRSSTAASESDATSPLHVDVSLSLSGLLSPESLIHCLMDRWNRQLHLDLEEALSDPTPNLVTPRQRAVFAIQTRLRYMSDYIASQTWASAMALGAHPSNVLTTQQRLRELIEIISAFVASSDPLSAHQQPSKISEPSLAMLGTIYVATELHLLTDTNPYNDTWTFLEHRVQEWDYLFGSSSSSFDFASSSSMPFASTLSPVGAASVAWTVSTAMASGIQSVLFAQPPSSRIMPDSPVNTLRDLLPRPPVVPPLPTLPLLGDPPEPLVQLWTSVFGDDGTSITSSNRSSSGSTTIPGTDPSHYASPSGSSAKA